MNFDRVIEDMRIRDDLQEKEAIMPICYRCGNEISRGEDAILIIKRNYCEVCKNETEVMKDIINELSTKCSPIGYK